MRGNGKKATEQLLEITQSPLFSGGEGSEQIQHSLRYNVHKNLAECYNNSGELLLAEDHFFQASQIDRTDVSLWFSLAGVAAKLGHLHMCRDALEEGFSCSPNHWPCLENLMTVSFKLDDNKGRPAKKHFSISDEIPEDLIEKRRSTRKMLTGVQPSLANSADSSQEVISSFRPNRQASLSPSACFEPVRLIIIR